MLTYRTGHEATGLASLAKALPGAEIVDPAARYTTSAGWRRAWPRLLRTLDALVVLCAPDDTVGTSVLHELVDAVYAGLPIAVLDDRSALCECRGVVFLGPDERCAMRAAWVLVGGRSDLPAIFGGGPHAPPPTLRPPVV